MADKELKKSLNEISNEKIFERVKLKINITTLNQIIMFLYKDTKLKTRKSLKSIEYLLKIIDLSVYTDEEALNRIWIIKNTVRARLNEGYENDEYIKNYLTECEGFDEYKLEILNQVADGSKISYQEMKHLLVRISDRVQFGFVQNLKRIYDEHMERLEDADDLGMNECRNRLDDLYSFATTIINIKRKNSFVDSDDEFSLNVDEFENIVQSLIEKLNTKSRIFRTGIQWWNRMLSPGYMGKRLYVYLAFPGGGKSQILLKSAIDIKKYNQYIECRDPDKRPGVLYITLENSIEETIERMFNMTVANDDIRNFPPKKVIKRMREEGGLKITESSNIDILMRYYKNREIDTNDLYSIIDDYADKGIEVVALIIDYVKRIRPSEKAQTEKEELKNITNELKSLATVYDIPVITAQQLNRTSSTIVENALMSKKKDVGKYINNSGVAGAWEIKLFSMVSPCSNACKHNSLNCGELLLGLNY